MKKTESILFRFKTGGVSEEVRGWESVGMSVSKNCDYVLLRDSLVLTVILPKNELRLLSKGRLTLT